VRSLHASLLAVGLLTASGYADPPEVPKVSAGIRLPDAPVAPDEMPPKPKPKPKPGGVTLLTPDLLYVVDSDVDLIVLSSPEGVIKVTTESGPVKVRGKFVDDPLRVQTKTFKGKWIFTVEAIKSGRAELILIPCGEGVVLPDDIIRRTIDVDDGTGPQPPPDPPTPPVPPPPTPVTSFRVIFVTESGDTLTAAQNSVIYGKTVSDYLSAKCTGGVAGWRRRDKDAPGESDPTMAGMWDAIKPKVTGTPCVAIAVERGDGKGIVVDILPLEATPAAQVATFDKYLNGGK
jgi:hypothetical protein